MSRPSDYTPEVAALICERIADGNSLRSICREDEMPDKATVFRWLAERAEFRDQYAHAREAQADTLADEALEIADDGSADYRLGGKDGTEIVIDREQVARSRLRVEQRRWHASKLAPKKYGDKVAVEASGPDGGPIRTLQERSDRLREDIQLLTPEERDEYRAALVKVSAIITERRGAK